MKQAASLGAISGLNILVAALAQGYILVSIGPGFRTDALFAAAAVPQFLLGVVRVALVQVLVPFLAGESEEKIRRDTSTFWLATTALFTGLAVTGGWLAPVWVPLLFPGFSDQARALTVTLGRIQLASMVFTAAGSVLVAAYQARRRFLWSILTPLLGDAAGLAVLVAALKPCGIIVAAWAVLASESLQVALLLPALKFRPWPGYDFSALRDLWGRLRYLVLGNAYFKTDQLVDRWLSSMTAAGGFSLFYLGQQGYGAANLVLGKALAVPALPALAARAKAGRWPEFEFFFGRRLRWAAGLACLGYAALVVAGRPALRLVIGHGAVTGQNVDLLWWLLVALGGVWMAGAAGSITTAAYYALGDTRTPTRLGIWTYTVYVPLKIVMFLRFGLIGLAVSSSVFFTANAMLQLWKLRLCVRRRSQYAAPG